MFPFLCGLAGVVIPGSVHRCSCVQSLRGHKLSRTTPNSTVKRSSERAEPKKETDPASHCTASQVRGEKTGSGVGRRSFHYGCSVDQPLGFAHIASTLNLSFSICNLRVIRVIIALISRGRSEDCIGRHLAVPGSQEVLAGPLSRFIGILVLFSSDYARKLSADR